MTILEISPSDTLPLRNEILRPAKDVLECVFDGDDAPLTRHFGALGESGALVGIVSVYRKPHPSVNSANVYQIRGMATVSTSRGKGVGRLLLAAAENYAKSTGAGTIWANARSSAVGFYLKEDYVRASNEFFIDGIGGHYLVVKSLDR